jgi:tetratricopeptide (TPR) repeat protein
MARELRKYILIIIFLFIPNIFFAALSEKEYFKEINELAETGKIKELAETGKQFLKDFPKSSLIADVRLILADNEADPLKAIEQFRALVNKYAYFKKRDYAQYKICEILYLQSKWNDLKIDSQKGIELFEKSEYLVKFKFFLAKALIHLEQFDAAKKVCIDITKSDHSYSNLSDALMLLSYINRNMYGISKSYLYSLSEIISGFKDSGNMPAALYLLGRYYQSKNDYNKAYSAYSDVVSEFPKSPEAGFSKKELSAIAQYNPSKTGYLPDKEAIKKSDNIDIQPEIDIDDTEENALNNKNAKSDIQYSISLGPFDNIKSAREIKNLISKDFQPVEIAEVKNGFFIYAGRFAGIDSALKTKIRLAEEFGINGSIVKIIKDSKKIYIYEE